MVLERQIPPKMQRYSKLTELVQLVRRSYPFFASAVRCEVVNWDFDAFSFLQLSEDGDQQLKVEGIRVVKVILVLGCELLLFLIQHLIHKHKVQD